MLRALPAGVKGEGQASWYERGKDLFSYSTKRASGGLGREGKESLSKSQSKGPDQTEHGGGGVSTRVNCRLSRSNHTDTQRENGRKYSTKSNILNTQSWSYRSIQVIQKTKFVFVLFQIHRCFRVNPSNHLLHGCRLIEKVVVVFHKEFSELNLVFRKQKEISTSTLREETGESNLSLIIIN